MYSFLTNKKNQVTVCKGKIHQLVYFGFIFFYVNGDDAASEHTTKLQMTFIWLYDTAVSSLLKVIVREDMTDKNAHFAHVLLFNWYFPKYTSIEWLISFPIPLLTMYIENFERRWKRFWTFFRWLLYLVNFTAVQKYFTFIRILE